MVAPPETPKWTFYPHRTAPGALDVVWCHFPLVEFPGVPGPKPRPALVRQVYNRNGEVYLEVCYGTSQATKYSDLDLYVANMNDMVDAGLFQATIFQLRRTVTLPWSEEWFKKQSDGNGPIIGSLNARCREYLRLLILRTKKGR